MRNGKIVAIIIILFIVGVTQFHSAKPLSMEEIINVERVKAGDVPLTDDPLLEKSATNKACDMLKRNYFSHNTPYGSSWETFIRGAGVTATGIGENMIWGFGDDVVQMNVLMHSPEHRDNILQPQFRHIGIGRCGKYVVQHFSN